MDGPAAGSCRRSGWRPVGGAAPAPRGGGRGGGGTGVKAVEYGVRDDAELVRLAQASDNRAFDELVRRYRDKVFRLSFKILRQEDDAAEALQDAFLSEIGRASW